MVKNDVITVAIDTLGCKVNQAESEQLARQLAADGYRLVPPDEAADVYILNTCTVTHIADRKSRHWLRMVHRRYPDALLVVAGCYAGRAAEELIKLEGVHLIISNADKPRLVAILNKFLKRPNSNKTPRLEKLESGTLRTRSFIKVQDGCHNFCTYCIVPFVRKDEECLPPSHVIEQVKQRQAEGYQEVVITGVEVGSYHSTVPPALVLSPSARPSSEGMGKSQREGEDKLTEINLYGLLDRILYETTIPRLRLSSLQPMEITPELIDLWHNPRLCRHFHLSLQSGSDAVLQRMNRRYTTRDYARAVTLIRRAVPEAAITTDIIVGFPGETEAEFADSYRFCKRMEFARIHVFPYSPRRGTAAATLPHRVDEKLKKQRTAKMLALSSECIQELRRRFLGKKMPVLFEQKDNGLWSGLTDNYIRVYVESEEDLTNRIREMKLGEFWGEGVRGEI